MMHFKGAAILAGILLFAGSGLAQSRIAVVDFERAAVGSAEGKKAEAKFNARLTERRNELEKKQKDLDDKQNKLKTQDRVLSETAKAELAKDIERGTTELTRLNEDAQKELDSLRQELLGPVVQIARRVLDALASEKGYDTILDSSAPNSNIIFVDKRIDITDELTKRVDAVTAAAAPTPAAPPPAAAPAPARATTPQ
jgi:outer membrane protein